MPRKQKSVYERIDVTQKKIESLEKETKELKVKLITLNKEKDELEMRQMFSMAKENNMSIEDVISAINVFSIKQSSNKK